MFNIINNKERSLFQERLALENNLDKEHLNLLYIRTKKELKGVFSVDELILIVSIFNSYYYNPAFTTKDDLIKEVKIAIPYKFKISRE